MSEKSEDEDMRKVRAACEQLGEHFDTVQVFCTRHESGELGGTVNIQFGHGNFFARYGVVQGWLIKQEESIRARTRQEVEEEEEE